MPRYLSPEWLAAFGEAGSSEAVRTSAGDVDLTLQQVVTGAPDGGDVRYVIRLTGGRLAVSAGDADAPDVTITVDHPTAVGIATGALSLPDALIAGRVKVKGDPARLLGASSALAGVTAVLTDLRASTTYP